MRTLVNKTKTKLSQLKTMVGIATTTAYLSTCQGVTVFANGDPKGIVKAACDVVVKFLPWIGAFFVISGVVKLILAYRNDQPEAQAGAAKDIVVGAVFVAFGTIVWNNLSGLLF